MGLCYRTIYGQGADKSTYAGEGGGGGGGGGRGGGGWGGGGGGGTWCTRELVIVILHDLKGFIFTRTLNRKY